jgi:RNA polymerase sigma factor for flagellar operon FliA
MVRTGSCIVTAHDFLSSIAAGGDVPPTAALAELVSAAISASDTVDERTSTVKVLCRAVAIEADLIAQRCEAELTTLTGVVKRRKNARLEPWLVKALAQVDIHVETDTLDTLDLLRAKPAQLAARLLASRAAHAQATTGYLATELEMVYDTPIDDVSIDEAASLLSPHGIDPDRLCWAAIARESSRHILLVFKEANRAARAWPDRSAESLVGYAYQGLRLALRNYDPSRGMFSTYACPRIRGTIRDGIRSESHLPKRLTTFIRKIEAAKEKLRNDLHRHPTLAEVAAALDIDLDRLAPLPRYAAPLSYEDLTSRPGVPEPHALVNTDEPLDALMLDARTDAVREALTHLDVEAAEAVKLLVLEGRSVTEAVELTGVPARQLRARRDRAITELAVLLAEWAPTAP